MSNELSKTTSKGIYRANYHVKDGMVFVVGDGFKEATQLGNLPVKTVAESLFSSAIGSGKAKPEKPLSQGGEV
ncbi:hypothetical protein [Phyllobacterium bourgognense]|uniref:Uncharacterized protein n=1 Tax=Phyllobacterium bourgognense TaxID=314236 RepID=A0A368Z1V9_9HYPH|nr:hypothetical protein [Phyllobacterium bourgognense]RCW85446.1 hypothetical protein C7476_103289 [Phyllobacterium bourgognense]